MMPRKFTDDQLDKAEAMHAAGEKWEVIDLILGEGIKQACYYRKTRGYVGSYNESLELTAALSAWSGIGDKQSFIDGWKLRAKRERVMK
ncbi:hypothetical protein D3C85_735800 [compost metagenome]